MPSDSQNLLVTRFAPSPTGLLHLGNARTALLNYLAARKAGGRFILRVEDTDEARSSEDFMTALFADLHWLGLEWDEGPDIGGPHASYRQQQRRAIYDEWLSRLDAAGLTYPCFCTPAELNISRKRQLASGQPPRYAGTCRHLTAAERAAREKEGRRPALRFAVPGAETIRFEDRVRGPQAIESGTIGDFPVRRADGGAVFFFCNAVDDALMGVTDVLRGDDHLANTPRQLLVLRALGLAAPRYGHLPLLLDPDGAPQSKRRGSVTISGLRSRGYLPGAIVNYLLRLGHHGAPDGWLEPADMARHFDASRLGRAPAHFDPEQLDHWQREAVLRLDPAAAVRWLAAALPADWDEARRASVAGLLKGNVLLPEDAREWLDVLAGELPPPGPEDARMLAEAGPEFFEAALDGYAEAGGDLAALADRLKRRTGRKGKALFMPLRLALTGRHDGPELAALVAAMPESLVRDRLAGASRLGSH